MMVFCPYPDLQKSVSCLDPRRLGNQVYREALILIRGGWPNHPISLIWKNHKYALAKYCLFGLEELRRRGRYYPHWIKYYIGILGKEKDNGVPLIIYNKKFYISHQSNLIRKDPNYYRPIFGDIPDNLPYVWKI